MIPRCLILSCLIPSLAACAAPAEEGSGPAPTARVAPVAATTVSVAKSGRSAPTVDPASQPAVDAAVAAFASAAGVDPSDVTVVSVSPVTWPDSSLGCGEPGQSYLQVLTPGYRVTLEAGEQRVTYHTSDGSRGPVQAVDCRPASARRLNLALLSAGGLDKARRDLAARLGGQSEIELADSLVADVTQLVCDGTAVTPRPGVPGYVVFEFHLAAAGTQHLYRAAGDEILYCGPYNPPKVDEHGNPTE